jgi:tetratricopeptide (TPR) repeat protein
MDTAAAPTLAAPVPPRARSGRAAALLGVVLLLTFLVYAGTLRFQFVYDDLPQILYNANVQSWHNLPRLFAQHVWSNQGGAVPNYYRPIFMAWCLVQFKLFGANPLPWHLALVMLHLVATSLVFQLGRRLLNDDFAASIAATLFGLHPIHLESVAWISGATDPLIAVFCLGSFLCYLQFRDNGARRRLWLGASLVQYALACLSKEPAVVFPGIIAVYEWLRLGDERPAIRVRHAVLAVLPYLGVAAVYLAQRWMVLRGIGHANVPLPLTKAPLSWPRLLWFYLHKLAWPAQLSLFYNMQAVLAPTWREFWLPLLLVAATAAGLWIALRRLSAVATGQNALGARGVAGLSLAWMLLPLLPVLNVIAMEPNEVAHDRYLYLPSVGFVLLVALLISRLRRGRMKLFGAPAAQSACVLMIASAMAYGTVRQGGYWADDLLLYYRAMSVAPGSLTAAGKLGNVLLDRNYLAEGIRLHEQIVRSHPDFWQSRFQLGNAYYKVGRYRESEEQLLAAARLHPYPAIFMYLAIAQLKNEHYAGAEHSARQAIAAWPTTSGGYYVLGLALEGQGKWPEAVAAFESELAIDPDQPRVREKLETDRHRGR